MRKLLIWAVMALPLAAHDNHVTIEELSGSSQGTRQFVIPRYFAQDEICANPKPYIGGSAVTYWQSHVETRWPASAVCAGGAAKFAVIIIETTLAAAEHKAVAFRNSAEACHLGDAGTCAAAGMTKADLLDFDAGGGVASWGARIQATTGGVTQYRSARAMIASNHYQIIRNGPIYAEVLVREGPDAVSGATTRDTNFGWRCTAGCIGPYATATWADDAAYYVIRPSFWLRFYRRWHKVEGDFVAHTGWKDRHYDQRIEAWEILTGGDEATAAKAGTTPFIIPARSTWWEETFWNGGTPGRINIDFNVPYLVYSRVIPPLNTARVPNAAIALETASYAATDRGETTNEAISPRMGLGQLSATMANAGANSYVGLFPRWTSRYIATMDAGLFDQMLGNARAGMHFTWSYLENATSGTWTAGESANPFGRFISIEQRPTFISGLTPLSGTTNSTDRVFTPAGNAATTTCTTIDCMVYTTADSGWYTHRNSAYTWSPWSQDIAHQVADNFIPYLVTGKPLFREAQYAVAAWSVAASVPRLDALNAGSARHLGRGLFYNTTNMARAFAWPYRTLGQAAAMAPDGSPEKTYFTRLFNNNTEAHEGRFAITNGAYPPASATAPYGCPSTSATSYTGKDTTYASAWCVGRYLYEWGLPNPMFYPGRQGNVNSAGAGFNTDLRYGSKWYAAWMSAYWAICLGHLRDLGFTQIAKVQETATRFFVKLFYDSGLGRDFTAATYYLPNFNAAGTQYIQTPSELNQAIIKSARLGRALTPSSTTIRLAQMNYNQPTTALMPDYNGGGVFRVDSEDFKGRYSSSIRYTVRDGVVTASDDVIAFPTAHGFTDGELIQVSNGFNSTASPPSGLAGDLPIEADPANCVMPSAKGMCVYYVHVLDANRIELHKDAALTQRVDFTADLGGNVYAGYTEFDVDTSTTACGGGSCRGIRGTAAASHAIGATVSLVPVWVNETYLNDPGFGYAHHYRVALAYGASYPISGLTDSVTGAKITTSAAYQHFASIMPYQDRYGDSGSCSGLGTDTCGSNRWAWISWPEVAPTNVRVTADSGSVTLRWVAPNGAACRYVVAASLDNPDDAGDASDGGGHKSRLASITGLSAGVYRYRISCGNGRALGAVVVP